jgi:hypothetical protein
MVMLRITLIKFYKIKMFILNLQKLNLIKEKLGMIIYLNSLLIMIYLNRCHRLNKMTFYQMYLKIIQVV